MTYSNTELSNCTFCKQFNAALTTVKKPNDTVDWYVVACETKLCRIRTDPRKTKSHAVKLWERRL